MPESSIFSALPGTGDLSLGALPTSVPLPTLDTDLGGMKESLMGSLGGGIPAVEMPDLSGAPSVSGFRKSLEEPLSGLTSIDAGSLMESAKGALPIEMPKAGFDVNGVVSKITSQVLPPEASGSMDTDIGLPPTLGDFTGPLRRLAEAGAATPLRMLSMMLTILDRLVETATDADKLKQFTAEALGEILVAQVQNLRDALPLAALEQARAPFDAGFLDRYQALLAQLGRVQDAAGPELLATVQAVRAELVPAIRHAGAAAATLGRFRAGDTDEVTRAVQAVVGFSTSDAVFLQPMFDRVEATVGTVVDAIASPVQQLAAMIGQIKAYLEMAADKAEEAATAVSQKLSATLRTLAGHLETAQARITELEEKVRAFIDKVDVGPVIEKFKAGLVTVVDGVDSFFTQVESVRKQLDDAVAKLDADVRVKFDEGLRAVEGQIRGLLDQITGVLDRPEVKDVLDQARQGVEKLKKAIEEASLQQVFDLVISKTGALEGKIQAIDTSRLGTPQKTALKVGVKIIQEVKVDDIVKPELEAAFAQIMGPLRELIQLLKDKVLFVEKKIDEFAPGTLVAGTIEPYLKPVFDALEGFRPSQLLQPLKDALDYLTGLLEQLDPQKLLDVVQGLYDQLTELVESLDPAPLNGMIAGAANTATAQLGQVRDVYLDDIVRTIKETVSLQKLLEGTGIQEIADAEFWDLLRKWLGGAFLDVITTAVDDVEKRLGQEFGGLDYGTAAAAVADVAKAVDAQSRIGADGFLAKVTGFQGVLDGAAVRVQQLDSQRRALLDAGPARPEVEAALRELALQPVLDLAAALKATAAVTPDAATAAVEKVKTALTGQAAKLRAINEDAIRQAVPNLFRTQLGDPVRGFVARMKVKLQPFADAVTAIQDFLKTTLQELPARVDRVVGGVLDQLKVDLKTVLGEVIDTIDTLRDAITRTITRVYEQVKEQVEKVNPAWVLNSFVEADLAEGGIAAMATAIAAAGDQPSAALQTRLASDQLELVRARRGDYGAAVIGALNGVLRDADFAARLGTGARTKVDADAKALAETLKTAQGDAWLAARKAQIRNFALARQLDAAQKAFAAPATRKAGLIRLNRVILEVHFPAHLKAGLQGLHPYVVETVAHLWPEETVARVDRLYADILKDVKALPDRLIRAPLDEAYAKVKAKLKETFDIQGIFRVVDLKIDGIEGDLSKGLDRLSVAYERLLSTLDQRLAA